MIKIKQHEDLNLREEVDRNWREITEETYSFQRLNSEVCMYNLKTQIYSILLCVAVNVFSLTFSFSSPPVELYVV